MSLPSLLFRKVNSISPVPLARSRSRAVQQACSCPQPMSRPLSSSALFLVSVPSLPHRLNQRTSWLLTSALCLKRLGRGQLSPAVIHLSAGHRTGNVNKATYRRGDLSMRPLVRDWSPGPGFLAMLSSQDRHVADLCHLRGPGRGNVLARRR